MQILMLPILLGLGSIAIPVLIHLLHRQKTTPIAWGAMRFLIPSSLQAKRRKKIEHWLLLLLRMAALAFLVFLLARPVLRSNPFGTAGSPSTDIVVVIDHSLSTGRRAAGEAGQPTTVFDRSLGALREVSDRLHAGDTLSVVLAEHKPRALTDRPVSTGTPDMARLRESLGQLKPGTSDADIPAAVQAAHELASHGRNAAKRVLVIGDDQRSGWQVENTGAWKAALGDGYGGTDEKTTVFDIPITADTAVSDIAVARVDVRPAVLGVGRPVELLATITNSGSAALKQIPVSFIVDGKPAGSQPIDELPGNSSRTLRFETTFTEPGSHWAKIAVDAVDALDADNTAVVGLNVLTQLPVLVIDGQLTNAGSFLSSQFLVAAMEPVETSGGAGALIRPKIVSASDAPAAKLDEYAAVVLNDVAQLPGDTWNRLADYARSGHGVWVVLGRRTDPKQAVERLSNYGLLTMQMSGPAKAGGPGQPPPPGVVLADPTNPMISLLAAGDRNGLTGAVTTSWWSLKPTDTDARVILATTGGEPLVLERPIGTRGGRVVVWASGLEGNWNNWPLSRNFVPLVQETVLHLAAGAVGTGSGSIDAGRPLLWSGPATPPVIAATIARPDGASTSPVKVSSDARKSTARYDDTYAPGLYELRLTPSGIPQPIYFGVSIDPRELDPSLLSESDVQSLVDRGFLKGRVAADKIDSIVGANDATSELWPALALVVLGILVLETAMTYRMIRLQASKTTVVQGT